MIFRLDPPHERVHEHPSENGDRGLWLKIDSNNTKKHFLSSLVKNRYLEVNHESGDIPLMKNVDRQRKKRNEKSQKTVMTKNDVKKKAKRIRSL